jgi:hypothetical protein
MKKIKWFLLFLVTASLSACAPAYYEASYYDYAEPSGHVAVVSNHSYANYGYRPPSSHYGSIELTLFADRSFLSVNFHPIHLVIHDGDYVEVPIRNKRGALKKVYAHYHRGDLHFDSGRHCDGIHGSSRFRYDKSWERGHRYDHISAGPDYDLRGYGLIVRKHVSKKVKHSVKNDVSHKNVKKHYEYRPQKTESKRRDVAKKVYVSDKNPKRSHIKASSVNLEPRKRKVTDRKIVIKDRVKLKEPKVKEKKVLAKKVKKSVQDKRTIADKRRLPQEKSTTEVVKSKKTKFVQKKKANKNKALVTKAKNKNEASVANGRKTKKKADKVDVEELVAVAGDERAGFVTQHLKPHARGLAKRK